MQTGIPRQKMDMKAVRQLGIGTVRAEVRQVIGRLTDRETNRQIGS